MNLSVYLYGICIVVGILLCLLAYLKMTKDSKMSYKAQSFYFNVAFFAIVLGFGSAALFQAFYNWRATGSWEWKGITFIGGLIGGIAVFVAAYFLFAKPSNKRWFHLVLEIAPSCILIAHAFGRLGCFFAGCCYGAKTDSFLGIGGAMSPDAATRYPTQLIEAIYCFVLFAVTVFMFYKKIRFTMPVYLGTYGVARILIELMRDDYRGTFLFGLSPSTFWAIMMILAAGAMVFLYIKLGRGEKLDALIEQSKAGTLPVIEKETDLSLFDKGFKAVMLKINGGKKEKAAETAVKKDTPEKPEADKKEESEEKKD